MCGQRASVVQASPQEKRHIHRRLADFAVAVSWPEDGHGRAVFQCLVRTLEIVQQSLRTPTEPSFGKSCTDGIRGSAFRSASTKQSADQTVLFFAAT